MSYTARRCPICGSDDLIFVYYAPAEADAPELYEYEGATPSILAKRIECSNCGATTAGLHITVDGAYESWNTATVLKKISTFKINNTEEQNDRY